MDGISQSEILSLNDWCKKTDGNFRITSQQTWVYNCIAFAMGYQNIWIAAGHPKGRNWYAWWPDDINVPRNGDPSSLVAAFQYMGFEVCEDDMPEEGYDKVVLYKKYNTKLKQIVWTHAAKVVGTHELHSKLGASFDVHHRDGDIFSESDYGDEYAYMRRPINMRDAVKVKLPTQCEMLEEGIRYLYTFDGDILLSKVEVPLEINLKPDCEFNVYGLHVRLVREEDAEFIVRLRTYNKNARFIHDTNASIAAQREWIRQYKIREAEGKEYYFIFEINGEPQGVYRIYNRHEEWCVTGSWVFKPDAERNSALKAMIITHEIVFDVLGHKYVHDVDGINENNRGVINAMKSIGGKFWGERKEEKGIYKQFDLQKEDFYHNRPTLLRFVGIKL